MNSVEETVINEKEVAKQNPQSKIKTLFKKVNKKKLSKALALSFVFLMLALLYLPIIVLIIFSFTNAPRVGVWNGFTFSVYADMFRDARLRTALLNTLLIGSVAGLLATAIGTASAVGIFYLKNKKRAMAEAGNRILIVNPTIVLAAGFLMLFFSLGLQHYGYLTLIITHTMICLPFVVLTVSPRLKQLNPSVFDAGQDLGAGQLRTLFTVIIPQLIPTMIASFALSFVISADDFIVTLFNRGGGATSVETLSMFLWSTYHGRGGQINPIVLPLSSLIFVTVFTVLIVINIRQIRKAKRENRSITVSSALANR